MSTQKQPKTPTVKGPGEWFTGDVYFNAYYAGQQPSRTRLNLVRFTPRCGHRVAQARRRPNAARH